jgi:hypothetical protein
VNSVGATRKADSLPVFIDAIRGAGCVAGKQREELELVVPHRAEGQNRVGPVHRAGDLPAVVDAVGGAVIGLLLVSKEENACAGEEKGAGGFAAAALPVPAHHFAPRIGAP